MRTYEAADNIHRFELVYIEDGKVKLVPIEDVNYLKYRKFRTVTLVIYCILLGVAVYSGLTHFIDELFTAWGIGRFGDGILGTTLSFIVGFLIIAPGVIIVPVATLRFFGIKT
jgi:hypothetical protein